MFEFCETFFAKLIIQLYSIKDLQFCYLPIKHLNKTIFVSNAGQIYANFVAHANVNVIAIA